MTDRESHAQDCACCAAYQGVLDLFNKTLPDGQVDKFVVGLLHGVAHIAAGQTLPGHHAAERKALSHAIAAYYDFYCLQIGKALPPGGTA